MFIQVSGTQVLVPGILKTLKLVNNENKNGVNGVNGANGLNLVSPSIEFLP